MKGCTLFSFILYYYFSLTNFLLQLLLAYVCDFIGCMHCFFLESLHLCMPVCLELSCNCLCELVYNELPRLYGAFFPNEAFSNQHDLSHRFLPTPRGENKERLRLRFNCSVLVAYFACETIIWKVFFFFAVIFLQLLLISQSNAKESMTRQEGFRPLKSTSDSPFG